MAILNPNSPWGNESIIIVKIKSIAPANEASHPETCWLRDLAGMAVRDCGATEALTRGLCDDREKIL